MSSETALVRVESAPGGLVTREYLQEKEALVRQLYAPEATDLEFEHFIDTCVARGLNPLAKQIYCVSRLDKRKGRKVATIQTGIDGFRLIAQRSGEYRGQIGPEWCGEDGVWRDVWLDQKTHPSAARVGAMRAGCERPFWGVVTWAAYADERSTFWSTTMGVNQLAKCAESLALRKAFPEELSGLYTTEEMHQARRAPVQSSEPALIDGLTGEVIEAPVVVEADEPATVGDPAPAQDGSLAPSADSDGSKPSGDDQASGPKVITEAQRRRLFAVGKGMTKERIQEIVLDLTGQDSTKAITPEQYDQVIETVEHFAKASLLDGDDPAEDPETGQAVLEKLKAKDA